MTLNFDIEFTWPSHKRKVKNSIVQTEGDERKRDERKADWMERIRVS